MPAEDIFGTIYLTGGIVSGLSAGGFFAAKFYAEEVEGDGDFAGYLFLVMLPSLAAFVVAVTWPLAASIFLTALLVRAVDKRRRPK